jgi:glycerol-3-phosphate dehydrogenase
VDRYDLLIVGGGINGAAIARDAAMRGATVLLVERDDLAAHTSSASSKLIHGGLRYLEYYEFRLVREALKEREVLLRTAPHIVRPLRFVLPHAEAIHPRWMVRAGLTLYDLFAYGGSLPRSRAVRGEDALLAPLKERRRAFSYWDAWVDDSRLTILNAVDAAEHGAEISTRTVLIAARRKGGSWRVELSDGRTVQAKALVNAAGPWVADTIARAGVSARSAVRLVKGSHIAVAPLWEGDHGYILQQPDGRVVFALPWLGRFTLIGTTDVPVETPAAPTASGDEIRYLCEAANRYFLAQIKPADVLTSYSGIRALYDDGKKDAKAVTRDWHLDLDGADGAPVLSVYGGKITTARALAEQAVNRLGIGGASSTSSRPLPGGDLNPAFGEWLESLSTWMPASLVARLSRAYGTRLKRLVGDATRLEQLGRHFGGGLYEAELTWLRDLEFARSTDDVLYRRTKLGLTLSAEERQAVEAWFG